MGRAACAHSDICLGVHLLCCSVLIHNSILNPIMLLKYSMNWVNVSLNPHDFLYYFLSLYRFSMDVFRSPDWKQSKKNTPTVNSDRAYGEKRVGKKENRFQQGDWTFGYFRKSKSRREWHPCPNRSCVTSTMPCGVCRDGCSNWKCSRCNIVAISPITGIVICWLSSSFFSGNAPMPQQKIKIKNEKNSASPIRPLCMQSHDETVIQLESQLTPFRFRPNDST